MSIPFRSLAAVALLLLISAPVRAQSPTDDGWSFSGQLTGVWTSGNAEASTFGAGATVRYRDEVGELKLEAGGIRTDASKTTRQAIGTPEDYRMEENEVRETTAETYFGRVRYDRRSQGGTIVFVGVDVLRNTFAGIDSRVLLAAGAGKVWTEQEDLRFKTDWGVTYTFQEDVVNNPFLKSSFPGTRVTAELRRRLTSTSRLESLLVSDLNFSDADDLRVDFTNSMPVAVSSAISLKPSLQLLWRNQPALRKIALFSEDGTDTGTSVTEPFEKLDSLFTLALVVTL